MAWSIYGRGVDWDESTSEDCYYLQLTQATLTFYDGGSAADSFLRMFATPANIEDTGFPVASNEGNSAFYANQEFDYGRSDLAYAWFGYMDATWDGASPRYHFRGVLNNPPHGDLPLTATGIPTMRIQEWADHPIQYVVPLPFSTFAPDDGTPYHSSMDTGTRDLTPVSGVTLNAIYVQPRVIAMPDGNGWFMVVRRNRKFADSTGNPLKDGDADYETLMSSDLPAGEPDSINDILGFWSNNLAFQHDDAANEVRGPFLLVDSMHALPGATFRLSLGTTGACFATDPADGSTWLYLVYVTLPIGAILAAEQKGWEDRWKDWYGEHMAGTVTEVAHLGMETDWTSWQENPGDWPTWVKPKVPSSVIRWLDFISAKRIALDDVRAAIDDDPALGDTGIQGAEREKALRLSTEVPGELLGPVRVWAARSDLPEVDDLDLGMYQDSAMAPPTPGPLDDTDLSSASPWEGPKVPVKTYSAETLRGVYGMGVGNFADPSLGWDESTDQLSMFFSVLHKGHSREASCDGTRGCGLYRAAALPTGTVLEASHHGDGLGTVEALHGRDWVLGRVRFRRHFAGPAIGTVKYPYCNDMILRFVNADTLTHYAYYGGTFSGPPAWVDPYVSPPEGTGTPVVSALGGDCHAVRLTVYGSGPAGLAWHPWLVVSTNVVMFEPEIWMTTVGWGWVTADATLPSGYDISYQLMRIDASGDSGSRSWSDAFE